MIRIKHIANIGWEQEFFDELNQKQYVVAEYDYSNTKKINTGDIVQVTFTGSGEKETFPAICSNYGRTVRRPSFARNRNHNYYKYRVLFRLTDEGLQFVKNTLVEQKV